MYNTITAQFNIPQNIPLLNVQLNVPHGIALINLQHIVLPCSMYNLAVPTQQGIVQFSVQHDTI